MRKIWTKASGLHVPHWAIYAATSAVYLGGCLGLEKAIVSGGAALAYAALAGEDLVKHRRNLNQSSR